MLVTVALLLSVVWPLLVLGAIVPAIANWAIAFVPLHDWLGDTAMQIVWIALAVIVPPIVGALVHAAARTKRTTLASAMLHGYLTTIGFFVATLVILVTVPIIKVASILRGWRDEHVYVQPHDGKYDDVLRAVGEACARAGFMPEVSDIPGHMMLATRVMRRMASKAVSPFVADDLRRVTSDQLQMVLYPGDLLLRGAPVKLARVRAMLGRTALDAHAYLVESEQAQHVQDELARVTDVLGDRVEHGMRPNEVLARRLRAIYREMMHVDLPFAEWTILETMARRLERRLAIAGVIDIDTLPLDAEPDSLATIAARANADQETAMTTASPDHESLDDLSTVQLVRRAVEETKQLARTELELAKQDLRAEIHAAKRAAIEFTLAGVCAVLGLMSLIVALVLTVGGVKLALAFGIGLVAAAAVLGLLGRKALPGQPLAPTRHRLADDLEQLKEHVA